MRLGDRTPFFHEQPVVFGPRLRDEDYETLHMSDLAAAYTGKAIEVEQIMEPVILPKPWHPAPFITPFERTLVWLRSLFAFERRDGAWTFSVGPIVVSVGDTPFRRARRHARLMAQHPPQGTGIEETVAWHRRRLDLGERRL